MPKMTRKSTGDGSVWSTGTGSEFPNTRAFAALKDDGSVVTWGNGSNGGDSSAVADQLSGDVRDVFSNSGAFAALKADGSVVTWGDTAWGGDSSAVADQLSGGVTDVFSNGFAFAALKKDGSVLTWGDSAWGGDSSAVADKLSGGVTDVFSADVAFAALKDDGSLVTWGLGSFGGDSNAVADQLSGGVKDVLSTGPAFAALKDDGSVVTWGDSAWGGDSSRVADQLSGGVTDVFSNGDAFAALKEDGSLVTWGLGSSGGDSSAVAVQLSGGVTDVFSTGSAFAALKNDGSVVSWGRGSSGGDSSAVADQLSGDVTDVFSTGSAFAALKADGSLVTWGHNSWGGDSSAVADQLSDDVTDVFSAAQAFAALKDDGSVVSWGRGSSGGDSSAVADQLSGDVTDVFSTYEAFAALKEDGSLVTWGNSSWGSDSSAVADQLSSGVVTLSSPFDSQNPGDGTTGGDDPGDSGPRDDDPVNLVGADVTFQAFSPRGEPISERVTRKVDEEDVEFRQINDIDETGPFSFLVNTDIDITSNEIIISFENAGSGSFASRPFNGYRLDFSGQTLEDVINLELVTNTLGIDSADVFQKNNSIFVDVGGKSYNSNDRLVVELDRFDDPVDPLPDPDGASPVDTSPLVVSAPEGWDDDGSGGVVNADSGEVFLGHADGAAALLRVDGGTVSVSSEGRVTVDGDVFAVRGGPDRPLFTGSFTIEPGALTATDFSPRSSAYGLLNDLVAVDFSQLSFSENDVALGADLDFPDPFNALDTTGGPLALRYDAEGLSFGPGRVGTSDWLPDFNLPLSAGTPVDLSFSDLGVDYDGLDDSLYLSGEATLGWGGTLADQFDTLGVPAQELKLDLAGERTGDALFERGEKFLRLRPDGDELAFDVVGDVGYASEAGFLREMDLGLDTIEQSFSGSVTGALGFSDSRTLTGELSGFWDPVAIDSVSFGMDGLNYPVATTGLFLQGGALGVDGLASAESGGSGQRSYSGVVDYTYGSAEGGLPTPIRGDIGGTFSSDSVTGSFSIRSTPGYILGDSSSGAITSVMENYFGLDPAAVLDFELLDASGEITANFAAGQLYADLTASVLGGVYSGEAELAMFRDAGNPVVTFGATGALEFPDAIPVIGGFGVNGNVAFDYSADDDLSNDFLAAWTTVDLGIKEFNAGLQVSFDGTFTPLGSNGIEKIASWELGPEMEVAVMSADWESARTDAALVVITPDGTRLSEADIAARDDIAIAPGLTTDTSRHVALETPEAGIWDIEMVAPDGLGEVIYSASNFRSGPTLDFAVDTDDRVSEIVDLNLTVDGLAAGSEIIVNALPDRDAAAGVRLEVDGLKSEDGTQTVTWDYSDFDPGTYYLEVVARGGGVAPESALTEDTIIVDPVGQYIAGTSADDFLEGGPGNDTLDGRAGFDTALYSGNQSSYTLMLSPTSTKIEDRRTDGNGTDTLIDMEFLDFDTGTLNLDQFGGTTGLSEGNFESFIELYIAYFNRAPDAVGLNFWGTAFANGTSLEEMATLFIDQPETLAAFPPGTSNEEFAASVYDNVLGRTPDEAGLDFWVASLNSGNIGRDQFILEALRGAKSDLKPELGQEFVDQQLADREFLNDKTDIGAYFAVHKGMSDVDNASAALELFDGSEASIDAAVTAIDGYYADALDPADGEFLLQVVGVLDEQFAAP